MVMEDLAVGALVMVTIDAVLIWMFTNKR